MPASKGQKYHKEIKTNKLIFFHKKKINNALLTHGKEVTKELRKVIRTGSRSGRVYFFRGNAYTASAPGEPPANRSGRLQRGFKYKNSRTQLIVYNTAKYDKGFNYPRHLEENMNRPYFINTIESLHYRLQKGLGNL